MARSLPPGRSHEVSGNAHPRWMVTGCRLRQLQDPAYRPTPLGSGGPAL